MSKKRKTKKAEPVFKGKEIMLVVEEVGHDQQNTHHAERVHDLLDVAGIVEPIFLFRVHLIFHQDGINAIGFNIS